MSVIEELTKCVGGIGMGAAALLTPISEPTMLMAGSVIGLAAFGLGLKMDCRERLCHSTARKALKDLRKDPANSDELIELALQKLQQTGHAKLTISDLSGLPATGDLATMAAHRMLKPLDLEPDGRLESILITALRSSIDACLTDPEFRSAMTLDLVRQTLASVQTLANSVGTLGAKVDQLPQALLDLLSAQGYLTKGAAQVSYDALRDLADKFEPDPGRPEAALIDYLSAKAQEYHNYRAQIDAIDSKYAALHNLKLAAQDAAARLDFAEVETLLSRVDEVETEAAAQTKELRAANFLLQGRVDEAYRIYVAAAASFSSVDELESARRRVTYANTLYNHGRRFGSTGLSRAIDLLSVSLTELSVATDPGLWAATQTVLAAALANQAVREHGAPGTTLLFRAVAAFDAALTVFSKAGHPLEWAATQNDLANALGEQAAREQGTAGAALLSRAVAAYEAALTVRTKAEQPLYWAATQNNLANALRDQAAREQGAVGTALLSRAAEASEAALTVYTKADHPLNWAITQNSLAVVLRNQAAREQGEAGTALLSRAAAACEAALTVRTKAEHPMDWAGTQNNLANALQSQAARQQGAAGTALRARAVAAYQAAVTVYTKVDHPLDWAMTQNNLANALGDQAAREQGPAGSTLHSRAVAAFEAVLTVYTKADHPMNWAMSKVNLAFAEGTGSERPECPNVSAALHRALAHVDDALTMFDPIHTAPYHAQATRLRDAILADLSHL